MNLRATDRRLLVSCLGFGLALLATRPVDAQQAAPTAAGSTATVDAESLDRARDLLTELTEADTDEVRRELYALGAAALRVLGAELERADDPGLWLRYQDAFESILQGRLEELGRELAELERDRASVPEGEPLPAPQGGEAALHEALEAEVREAGYGAARELARPGAAREELALLARRTILDDLDQQLRLELRTAAGKPPALDAMAARLQWVRSQPETTTPPSSWSAIPPMRRRSGTTV